MNILQNSKIRFFALIILAALQIICFTIIPKPYSDYLFYLITLSFFPLGFLSIDWKQAIKNITWVTIPTIVLIALPFLLVPIINGKTVHFYSTLKIALQLWALFLTIGLPIFLLGFGARFLVFLMLKLRRQKL
jgi:hypothetical protein